MIVIVNYLKAGNFDGMMTLRVNDHEYKVKDIISPRKVHLNIFDLLGRKINTLKSQTEDAGWYAIIWDGRDYTGNPVATGMYIITITAQSIESDKTFIQSQKVVLMK